jgi:recombination protein RecA
MSEEKLKKSSFLNKFDESVKKIKGVSSDIRYPEFFFDSGSCIINKVISEHYSGGYAEGRMTMITGPANSGKSFLCGNAIKCAQDKGFGVFIIDSEQSLDSVYLSKIGVNVNDPNFIIKGLNTISSATQVINKFFEVYNSLSKDERIPFLIVIDSLDFLSTDAQTEKFERGEMSVDMGIKIKQLADLQANILHNIKPHHIAVIATKAPYANQDPVTKKRIPWIITPKLMFAYSQVLLVTNTWIKDNTSNIYEGINLTVFGFKTRFAKPFQKCVIDVPYETGMDWYTGILEAAESMGIINKNKAWYEFENSKFQKNKFNDYKKKIFECLLKRENEILAYNIDETISDELE